MGYVGLSPRTHRVLTVCQCVECGFHCITTEIHAITTIDVCWWGFSRSGFLIPPRSPPPVS